MVRQVQVLRRDRAEEVPELGLALRRPGRDDDLRPGGEVGADDPLADRARPTGTRTRRPASEVGERGQDVSGMRWTFRKSLVPTT
ncbi:hypothetical protein GCM10022197_11880 [Microlunatus spumicola]|uniref:Uncharacterized protein n=1 Tax=Microlunatus spumicola TaxID=81499 RepID=A0ABP6X336_9ACTN